jgi:uncharacterized RDD family membrane protein YckC
MQKLLYKRLIALLIDALIITLFLWLIAALVYPMVLLTKTFSIFNNWPLAAAIAIIGYFTYMEGKKGFTIGKETMKIKVIALNDEMDYKRAFIRNLTKIYWFPLIPDFFLGWVIGDTNRRFFDHIASTQVINLNKKKL